MHLTHLFSPGDVLIFCREAAAVQMVMTHTTTTRSSNSPTTDPTIAITRVICSLSVSIIGVVIELDMSASVSFMVDTVVIAACAVVSVSCIAAAVVWFEIDSFVVACA